MTAANVFVRANSTNLPKMDIATILTFMGDSSKHNSAEIRGAKVLMSSRSSYLETSIGYVEIQRLRNICTVRAKVAPEHRVRLKPYIVTVTINEKDEEIMDTECDGCAAALGGCKHTLVVLFWLSKKTDEPACTSVTCYWKKPKLFDARVEPVESKNIFRKGKKITLKPKNINVLEEFQQKCIDQGISNSLITCFKSEKLSLDRFNIFDMMLSFIEKESDHSFMNFKNFIDCEVSEDITKEIDNKTIKQSSCKLWHNLRQARITASQIYDSAHCSVDGSLVQKILGGYKVPETVAIQRGKILEDDVLKEVQRKVKTKIQKSGFILINGLIGSSPDGICKDYVVEVKCPMSVKSFSNYVKNKTIKPKFKAQICLQMLAAKKKRGLFCIADPNFENNRKVHMYWIDFDREFTQDIMKNATSFWEKYIFPKVLNSAKF